MYVIFPLDDLLDIKSASNSLREASSTTQTGSSKRNTVEVLLPSHPSQQLPTPPPLSQIHPSQHKPPPSPTQQQPPQHQQLPQQQQQTQPKQPQKQTPQVLPQQSRLLQTPKPPSTPCAPHPSLLSIPQQVTPGISSGTDHNQSCQPQHLQRQQSFRQSHSNFIETSTSSGGAKTKVVTSQISPAKPSASNRASWAGSSVHSYTEDITRSASFRDFDLRGSGNSQGVEPRVSDKIQSVQSGDTIQRSKVIGSNSFRSLESRSVSGGRVSRSGGSFRSQEPKAAEVLPPCSSPNPETELPVAAAEDSPRHEYCSDSLKSRESSSARSRGSSSLGRGGSLKNPGALAAPRVQPKGGMASEGSLRELTHPALNEPLKQHNAVTFKLVKTDAPSSSQHVINRPLCYLL